MARIDSGFGDAVVVSDFLDKVLVTGITSIVDEMRSVGLFAEAIESGQVDKFHVRYAECVKRSIMRNVVFSELQDEQEPVDQADTLFRWGVFMLEDVDGFAVDSYVDLVTELCGSAELASPVSDSVEDIKQARVAEGLVYASGANELLASGSYDKRAVFVEQANYIISGTVESESSCHLEALCFDDARSDVPVVSREVVLAMNSAVCLTAEAKWDVLGITGADGIPYPDSAGEVISALQSSLFRLCKDGPLVSWERFRSVAFSVGVASRLMLKSGYCYLRVVPPRDRLAALIKLGSFPTAGMLRAGFDVAGWSNVQAVCHGDHVKHVSTCGNLPMDVLDESPLGADSHGNSEVLASFDAVIRRLGDKARLENSTMASGSYGIPPSVQHRYAASYTGSTVAEVDAMTPRRLSGRGSESLTLQVPRPVVGFSGVDQMMPVPSEDAARSNVRKTSLRADLLVSRLDTGACVSDKYMRSAARAIRQGKPVPESGEPKGRVVVLPGTRFGAGASLIDLSKLESVDMPGWVSRRVSVKAGQVDLQTNGWARLDLCFDGDMVIGDVVLSADRTVVWFSGPITLRAKIHGSSKASVWLSQPLVGMANAVGWEGMTLAAEYSVPLIRPLVKDSDDVPNLPLSLLQTGSQMAGLIRLRGEAKLKQVRPTRLVVSTDWDKQGFAVISVSGHALSHVTVAGVSVKAIDGIIRFITDAWHDAVVVSAGVAGRLKFVVDMVGDKSVFEAMRAASPETPVLTNYEFGS